MRVLVLLVAAPLVATGCSAFGGSGGEATYTEPTFRYTLTYPERWDVARVAIRSRASIWSTAVANSDARRLLPRPRVFHGFPSGWVPAPAEKSDFPAERVALRISALEGGPPGLYEPPEARFPLRLSTWQVDSAPRGVAERRVRAFTANGRTFTAEAWIGREAGEGDRRALARVVESIRFPALAEGATAAGRYRVLARASRYAVGSVTWLQEGTLYLDSPGVFLIRTPRGFYGLSTNDCSRPRFRRRSFEFSCGELRWDRTGRRVGARRATHHNMWRHRAKVAQDGHVLLSFGRTRWEGPTPRSASTG